MFSIEDWVMPVVLVLTLVTLAGFALGTRANVRAGDRAAKWLREGLPLISDKTTMTWIGSAALLLKMAKAKGAYRSAETLFSFEPRDIVLMWLFAHWQGRRDTMIFRGTLTAAPEFELEIFDPQGWMNRGVARQAQRDRWTRVELSGRADLRAYSSGALDAEAVNAFAALGARAGGKLTRLSIRKNLPNVQVHWRLPDPHVVSARALFNDVREMGKRALNLPA
ncbi:MAG: hypothetical protein FJ009_08280 [Chloroflexi bacterium]|nr:hypothetical protein [Chloroflexota bacterium]